MHSLIRSFFVRWSVNVVQWTMLHYSRQYRSRSGYAFVQSDQELQCNVMNHYYSTCIYHYRRSKGPDQAMHLCSLIRSYSVMWWVVAILCIIRTVLFCLSLQFYCTRKALMQSIKDDANYFCALANRDYDLEKNKVSINKVWILDF